MKKVICLSLLLLCSPLLAAKDPEVMIKTSHGDITLRLFADKAPITVENFMAYVESGFYRGTIFHRVIPRFMIQGGGFDQRMQQKETLPNIVNEAKNRVHNERGTIAMARTNDPDSASSQWFINVRNNFNLDWAPRNPGYTVFGEVIDGMYTVDSIAIEPTGNFMGFADVPVQPVIITDVVWLNPEPAAETATEASAPAAAE
jgi:cyclophilin family peptidyl-prolyl cis-trans isomerase